VASRPTIVAAQAATAGARQPRGDVGPGGPVVILSYPNARAWRVQDLLAAGTDLMCTCGTGILQQCAGAAKVWRQLKGREGPASSPVAVSATPGLIQAEMTAMLTEAGKSRWCELAMGSTTAAQAFLQVFPDAAFVCVHRCCQDVIRASTRVSPWELQRQIPAPYLLSYCGNTVAALAAYWVHSAEQLLAFERANPGSARRIRYEDMAGDAGTALGPIRSWLRLDGASSSARLPGRPELPEPREPGMPSADPPLPLDMIPRPLSDRVASLNAELGYPAG